ncbi:GOLPH3/VPS74 family protein [Ornithinimicrobium avium]|nr:GPP34 family phosphoprotein [Ornithinimicrobium avium]
MTTIAEDLLLLLTRDNGSNGLTVADTAVGGALLAELAGTERVDLDERGRIRTLDSTGTGDALLDEAMVRLGDQVGRKPEPAVQKVGKGMAKRAYEQLARAELVEPREHGALGVTLWTSWRPLDEEPAERLRSELVDVLAGRRGADLRTGTLLSLLLATDQLGRGLPKEARGGLTMREIKRSAKEVSRGRWAGEAVHKAMQDVNAAVMTAVFAGGATAST